MSDAPDADRGGWQAALPDLVRTVQDRWSLEVGAPFEPGGTSAWVAPARRTSGEDVVVKIGWPHPESEHEADGLAFWAGDGTVRLLEAMTVQGAPAMLLERCLPGTTLTQLAAPEVRDDVVAGLLLRLRREPPPGHGFRPLRQMCEEWAAEAEQELDAAPHADLGPVRAGLALFRSLAADADREVVLFTDLHADNILSATREPWLAIDPKPYVGDPTYDVLQHMLNVPRLMQDPDGLIARMASLADLDEARLRLWTFARCAVMAVDDPAFVGVLARLAG
jgi:streptomycin 6-kinase